ncbi:unnamed protein product [Caenorhabditis angaria]|uniref:PDZ domain-containing protein n=1 Tax=Caenorhabditis angaria TaxID=860376 RepID=A0A9P1J0C7_9PELO|nr:unnamed protein product [Caenorhabditis angaria]
MSSSNRLAPMPPPKPRSLVRGQFYHGVDGFLTPQDSDTDSGISADCDQSSPRGGGGATSVGGYHQLTSSALRRHQQHLDPYHHNQTIRSHSSNDYLTPNSARKIAAASGSSLTTSSSTSSSNSTPRRLPPQPTQQQQQQSTPTSTTLTKAKYRVRFADEVDSGASTSSGTSSAHISPRNDQKEMLLTSDPHHTHIPQNISSYSQQQPIIPNGNNKTQPRSGTLQRGPTRRTMMSSTPQPQPTYVDQIPDPPSYNLTMQRLRSAEPVESFRDAYIRKNVADTLQRRFRQRSSSLPRGNKSYYEGIDIFDTPQPHQQQHSPFLAQQYPVHSMQHSLHFPTTQASLIAAANQLPGSLDNLHITMGSMKRRKLPTAPLMGSMSQLHHDESDELTAYRALQFQMMRDEYQRQSQAAAAAAAAQQQQQHQQQHQQPQQFDRQPTLLRRTILPKPAGPVQFEPIPPQNPADFGPNGVRAQLIALDQRGYRRVLVEKLMPGPFGFYIATGMVACQRGIFISRVSLPSLSPMLTVGDEIIYVDEELVKGRSLEYVQSVIAGKTTVTITLLPAVGQPALC